MPNIQHATLTGADLHEPKGVDSASEGSVYVADGAGSGTWEDFTSGTTYVISGVLDDISTASSVYVPVPEACTVNQITTVLGGSISGADATVTVGDSSSNTMGTIVIGYSGSAAGDIDTATPSTNNVLADNTFITVQTDGGSTDVAKLYFSLLVERT